MFWLGRQLCLQVAGLTTVNYAYDTRGRLAGITQGSGATQRSLICSYGADGFVQGITGTQPQKRRPPGRLFSFPSGITPPA